jgi:hypothetical protein
VAGAVTSTISLAAGISAAAARNSSIDPNGSAVPCVNTVGTLMSGREAQPARRRFGKGHPLLWAKYRVQRWSRPHRSAVGQRWSSLDSHYTTAHDWPPYQRRVSQGKETTAGGGIVPLWGRRPNAGPRANA